MSTERFTDEGDLAAAHADRYLQQALDAQRERARGMSEPTPDDECEWCGEGLDSPRVFCSMDCSRAWDRARRQRLQAGLDPDD